jgi:hypothetical protein
MTKTVHNFQQSINVGKSGEEIMYQYLRKKYEDVVDVTKQKQFYPLDIDYVCSNKRGENTLIEVKTDTYTGRNGNIFLETWSNVEKEKQGWPYYTEADEIWYYAVGTPYAYVFKGGEQLLELLELFLEEGEEKDVWNKGYTSKGVVLGLDSIPSPMIEQVKVIDDDEE